MVDRMLKVLNKLSKNERLEIDRLIELIVMNELQNLDVKKLKGIDDVYRVRKGKIRIIFKKNNKMNRIIAIERRTDTTYREF